MAPNQAAALIPQVQAANQKILAAYVRPESKTNFTHVTMVPALLGMLNRISGGEVVRTADTPGVAYVASSGGTSASGVAMSLPAPAGGLTSALGNVGLTPVSGFVLLLGLGLAGTMGFIALSKK